MVADLTAAKLKPLTYRVIYEDRSIFWKVIRDSVGDIPDCCCHLYSSCGSTKNLSQQAKLWIPGSTATFCGDCVKTCEDVAPRTFARTGMAASPWQRTVSHFRPHPAVSGEIQMAVIPHPPYSPDLAPCDFFLLPFPHKETWTSAQTNNTLCSQTSCKVNRGWRWDCQTFIVN
jgi:hypothetical protein